MRAAGIPAATVGEPPFAALGGREVAADRAAKANRRQPGQRVRHGPGPASAGARGLRQCCCDGRRRCCGIGGPRGRIGAQQQRDKSGPPGLMRRAAAPCRCRRRNIRRTAGCRENRGFPARSASRPKTGRRPLSSRKNSRHSRRASSSATSPRCKKLPGADRAFDLEIVAVIAVKSLQRLDQQIIDRQPDRAAPVGIAAETPRSRTRRAHSRR